MARMANKDNVTASGVVAFCTIMDTEHQRAARVQHMQVPFLGIGIDVFGYAVSRKDDYGAFRDLVDFIDKDNTLLLRESTTNWLCTISWRT
jgi:hypothetical protein